MTTVKETAREVLSFIVLAVIVFFTTGCAARLVNTSQLQYLAPEFNEESLAAEGLGLLPIVAGTGQEGIRRPLADKLNILLYARLPERKFLGNLETMDLINDAALTGSYARLITDYNRSAILDKSTLRRINGALGVRYVLYVKLLEQSITAGATYSHLLESAMATTIKEVRMFGQVWDCMLGDVVWEGTGEVFAESGELTYVSQSLEEMVNIAARSFLNNLPGIQTAKAQKKKTAKAQKKMRPWRSNSP